MYRVICIFLILYSGSLFGQFSTPIDTIATDTTEQTYVKKKSNVFKGEPGKAALYSLIIPGGGQVYNRDYWKVPLVLAGEGAAVYYLLDNTKKFNDWNTCYLSFVNKDNNPALCSVATGPVDQNSAFRIRNGFRSRKELSYVFVGLAHLLNIVEAYVDRHLTLFDISDDLSFLEPISNDIGETRIEFVSIKFSLNK